ncbi:AraC-type DNA-binding protein [Paenibacillus algorifonticola]|uniref:AraC-type DNA-binding protein n=1 Tax=Paenibacillus algorifonticola TaxID=684063 RepID=A0A1I2DZ77_9BACL|nr:AraC family transcriptional regulator [Paenibacillus algorifonticola]SFE85593.1 AraC-type DNA-binding protein [Paenibacillus algorifonticola]
MDTEAQINKLQMELATRIQKHAAQDGSFATAIPLLHFIRQSDPSELVHVIHEPALCFIAQGTKLIMLGEESYLYDPNSYLVVSMQLPISGQVLQASADCPYLCLRLELDRKQIFDLLKPAVQEPSELAKSHQALFVSNMNELLLDALVRMVRLLDTPEHISALAPLITKEIFYRMLQDEHGQSIKQFVVSGSHAERIAKAVQLIEQDYNKQLRIEELAEAVNMSSSLFHHHFKEITAMSPLQFQKQIRLQKARTLLLSGTAAAADAGFQVGYESPNQFNREYTRMFGMPPIRDMKRLRGALIDSEKW